jgi:hypothetical protein
MSRADTANVVEEEPIQEIEFAAVEQGEVVAAEVENQPRKRLDCLMRRVLARRDEVRTTQQKLREIEIELRTAPTEKRGRFVRMREAALAEYRNARAEAARTRHQLLSSLRMLPSRS